jgi:hypothetical protein
VGAVVKPEPDLERFSKALVELAKDDADSEARRAS